ncbi:nucleotide exchange factor GrpE [Larkinella arboricola]|uniref:Protein GrpE n=1 Tax=Larkinella arboricola TaxID=643671 RepID=A0A327X232_LARAB|nr:nucleotide exchange factor GrpE [Larkinella arboricola]RAJ99728.1 molecular chaperone GrpE [Larkinella arboricola]
MENKETLNTEEQENVQQPDNTVNESTTDIPAADNTSEEPVAETAEDQGVLSEFDKVSGELTDLKDKYLRLYADFENFRRRTAKEKVDLISNANEGLLVKLLPVLDDFERALKSAETSSDAEALKEGVQLIYNKFYKVLESKGVKSMESVGQAFNPDLHEAITQFPAPSDDLKGKVIDETEKGYFLNDKVIRFAKVILGA